MRAGIFTVPEDRKGRGLPLPRGATEKIMLPWEATLGRRGLVTDGVIDTIGAGGAGS